VPGGTTPPPPCDTWPAPPAGRYRGHSKYCVRAAMLTAGTAPFRMSLIHRFRQPRWLFAKERRFHSQLFQYGASFLHDLQILLRIVGRQERLQFLRHHHFEYRCDEHTPIGIRSFRSSSHCHRLFGRSLIDTWVHPVRPPAWPIDGTPQYCGRTGKITFCFESILMAPLVCFRHNEKGKQQTQNSHRFPPGRQV